MPNYVFSYRNPEGYDALARPEDLEAWGAFLNDVIAPQVVDPGFPVFEPSTAFGEVGKTTQLGGYSIITADNLDEALAMAKSCPTLASGGGIEVGVLATLPPEHPAEQIRSRLSAA